MAKLLRATVTIVGTRPVLWHKFGPEAIPLDKRQEKTGVAGHDPEEWRRSVCFDPQTRQLYFPPTYIFGMVRAAAKFTKKGARGSIQPMVAATLQIDDQRVYVDRFLPDDKDLTTDSEQPVYIDIAGVKNPGSGGRNVRYRVAASPGWQSTFHLLWDRSIVARNEMESVLQDAGMLVGLADGRSIGFGRFEVVAFEVEDAQKTTPA